MRARRLGPLLLSALSVAWLPSTSSSQAPIDRQRAAERAFEWLRETIDPETWTDGVTITARASGLTPGDVVRVIARAGPVVEREVTGSVLSLELEVPLDPERDLVRLEVWRAGEGIVP